MVHRLAPKTLRIVLCEKQLARDTQTIHSREGGREGKLSQTRKLLYILGPHKIALVHFLKTVHLKAFLTTDDLSR